MALGYIVFYLRYENTKLIDELRTNMKELNKQHRYAQNELDEHLKQNQILRSKVGELYTKNEDLTNVVSELSRYYYHIKVGAEKVSELSEYLQLPDANIAHKVTHYASQNNKPQDDEPEERKFF